VPLHQEAEAGSDLGEFLMAKKHATRADFIEQARSTLAERWQMLRESEPSKDSSIPEQVQAAIAACINSETKTYRYVLPTQILGKLTDPGVDIFCVQAQGAANGGWDARSLCHKAVVEFDRENAMVLGGSAEPYLNNPLRIPRLDSSHRTQQKDKAGFDSLLVVLAHANKSSAACEEVFAAVLKAIKSRLEVTQVLFPVPNRLSLEQAMELMSRYLHERTGGARLQAVATALFDSIGSGFSLYARVESDSVNAADASTGAVSDIRCLDAAGKIVLAVEVKDRDLSVSQMQDKLPEARQQEVRELLFLIRGEVPEDQRQPVSEIVSREFSTGHNLHVHDFEAFARSVLVLMGEEGRRRFVQAIGSRLDQQGLDLTDRQAWRDLLIGL
jgi:hypothetical protein